MGKRFIVFIFKHLIIPIIVGLIVSAIFETVIGGIITGGITSIASGFIGDSSDG